MGTLNPENFVNVYELYGRGLNAVGGGSATYSALQRRGQPARRTTESIGRISIQ